MTLRTPINKRRAKPRRGPIRLKGAAMTALRKEVFERDYYRCQHILYRESTVTGSSFPSRCLKRITWDSGHLAHIISRGRGGDDSAENCLTKCPECHLVHEHNPKSIPKKERAV